MKARRAEIKLSYLKGGPRVPRITLPRSLLGMWNNNRADTWTLQETLLQVGERLPRFGVDGIFGPETQAAVISFQKRANIGVDGIVGPITWAALEKELNQPQPVEVSRDIEPYLTGLTYDDNGVGAADSITLQLQDKKGRWHGSWMPEKGDRVQADIILRNWRPSWGPQRIPCGQFEIDTIRFQGPPDTAEIQALSLPGNSSTKSEKRTRSWEDVTLSQIARTIASRSGLGLMFQTDDVRYDRIDQSDETDITFLFGLVEEEGASLKISNNRLVVFDDRYLESQRTVRTFTKGTSNILSYGFEQSTVDVDYAACEVSYFEDGRTIRGSYRIAGKSGPTLKINERVSSAGEARRKARAALRNKNKEANKMNMTILGDPKIAQGVTIQISGFKKFDGKYYIESVQHSVGSGYSISFEARKVLNF